MVGVAAGGEGRGGASMLASRARCDCRKGGEQREVYRGPLARFWTFWTRPLSPEGSSFFVFWYEIQHSSLLQGACSALNNAALNKKKQRN